MSECRQICVIGAGTRSKRILHSLERDIQPQGLRVAENVLFQFPMQFAFSPRSVFAS
jgi:hypothetical protein